MIVTPTNTGSIIAGAGVGIFGWSIAEEGDKMPLVKTVLHRRPGRRQMFTWASKQQDAWRCWHSRR